MFLKRYFILLFFISACLFVILGCSSSSNVTRYGEKPASDTHKNGDIRFSSDNDETKQTISSAENNDTSYVRDLDYDSDPDVLPANETHVDISKVFKKINTTRSSGDPSISKETPKEKMLMEILKYINTPYKYGGSSSSGIDCSAFTQEIFSKSLSIDLQRTARGQFHEGDAVKNIDDLRFGDLVFFDTRRNVKPGHVGIYIGDHLFAHASKSGVTVSSIDMEYYAKRFMGGRRIEQNEFGSK